MVGTVRLLGFRHSNGIRHAVHEAASLRRNRERGGNLAHSWIQYKHESKSRAYEDAETQSFHGFDRPSAGDCEGQDGKTGSGGVLLCEAETGLVGGHISCTDYRQLRVAPEGAGTNRCTGGTLSGGQRYPFRNGCGIRSWNREPFRNQLSGRHRLGGAHHRLPQLCQFRDCGGTPADAPREHPQGAW